MVGLQAMLGPTLVLSKFKVNESATDGPVVEIEGRAAGIIGFLMTVFGLGAKTTVSVTVRDVTLKSTSLFGQAHNCSALANVASTHCGFSRPLWALVLGVVSLLYGIGQFLAGMMARFGSEMKVIGGIVVVVAIILFVVYALGKKMYIYIQTNGGAVMGLKFKRSVIENVPVDINLTLKAIETINDRVVQSHSRG